VRASLEESIKGAGSMGLSVDSEAWVPMPNLGGSFPDASAVHERGRSRSLQSEKPTKELPGSSAPPPSKGETVPVPGLWDHKTL
jgi:hypothetical protein